MLFAAIVFAGTPAPAHATAQSTSSALENLVRLLDTNRGAIGNQQVEKLIQSSGTLLAQRIGIDAANIPQALGRIESLRTAITSYQQNGGNPQALISTIQQFAGNDLPQIRALEQLTQFGNITDFSTALNFVKSRVPAEISPFINAVAQGGEGIKGLALNFAKQKIGEALAPSLSSAIGVLQTGNTKVPAPSGFGGFGFGQLIDNFITPEFQQTAQTVLSGSLDFLNKAGGGLLEAAGSIAGVDASIAQAAAALGALPQGILDGFFKSPGENLIANQGSGPRQCSVSGGAGAGGGVGQNLVSATADKLKGSLGSITQNSTAGLTGQVLSDAAALTGINTSVVTNAFSAAASGLGSLGSSITSAAGLGGLGGGKGVPVIEQGGALLDTTKENRAVNLQSCNTLNQVLHLMTEVKKTERQQAVQASLEAAGAIIDQANASLVADHEAYERLRQKRAVKLALEDIKNNEHATAEEKQTAARYAAVISGIDDQGALGLILEKPEVDPSTQFLVMLDPQFGTLARLEDVRGYIATKANDAIVRAQRELDRNEGFTDSKKCLDESCREEHITQSGDVVKQLGTAGYLTPLDLAKMGDDFGETPQGLPEQAKQIGQNAREGGTPQPPPGAGQQILDDIIQEGEQSQGNVGDLLAFYRTLCRISSSLPFCSGIGGDNNTGGGNNNPPPPPANPTLTFASSTEHVGGVTLTRLSWQTDDVAQCFTSTEWTSFGDGGDASVAPSNLVQNGISIGANGSIAIFHPSVFRANAAAVEGETNQNGIVPPSQTNAIANRITYSPLTNPTVATVVTQRSTYTPNISSIEEDDIITFGLNNLFIGAFASTTSQGETSNRLRTGLTNTDLDTERTQEYANYAINGTDTVNTTRSIEVQGNLPTQATYGIRCVGSNQAVLQNSTRVSFTGDL